MFTVNMCQLHTKWKNSELNLLYNCTSFEIAQREQTENKKDHKNLIMEA